ncbi:hypothetical protein Pmar_PMAR018773 [Perkinsus marinus ATCC 50983]|uniref:Peptidase A2 domain-containing protein n=1 Tax=Perkinsus marinus (strain ATCC 50983 / TXsc) TaxID=423536 RepID=C5KJC0_PERM5|nr:hypothetical protein Pmar_PMAR018773 [Perkinsus marinus ATCC 50983]EER15422.1 hypothetical protein Pmar_PMAR018773 [Perkinsus marinus ATCC 50983]|eukprot:XP_002783626.1 hypothetical protein Pmar_PMAR018773 [Perkinsus marinus ATCC 50983]
MGFKVTPARGLKKLESAGSLGSICLIGQARVPLVVKDKAGHDLSFNLQLNVADGLNMKLGRSTIILGMETLKRLEATLHTTDDTLYCGALGSTWSLSPYSGGSISSVLTDTRLKLPSRSKVDERLKGWSFPKVTVQLKPGAVRPCPKRPYVCRKREMQAMELMVKNLEKSGIITRLSRAAVDHRQVWISPAFAVPKAAADDVAEPLTEDNVDRAYRLVVDERCINESVMDLLPSWGTYMRSVDECLSELPSSDVWYAGIDVGQAFFNLEYDGSCAPQSHNPGAKEVKEYPVGRDNAAGGGNSKDGKSGCSYCATRRYRGANKHDDARCWKNPANAHLVPDWYRQRQAEAAAAKASKGQGDGQETVPKAVQSTFMPRSVDSAHEGLRVIRASATGSSGRILPVELLVDSGSDLTLISSSSASIMGFKVTPARGLKKLESAGSLGSICLIGQARVPLVVKDKAGHDLSFNLQLNVADGLKHPGLGPSDALGKIEGRLNSSTYQPTTRQTKRWLSWLADLLEYDEADLTYRHAKGKDNSFSDLLSRLAQGGQRYVPEGGGEAFVLVTSTSPSQSELPTTDRSASVHDSTRCILAGDLRVQLITLQKADSSTLLHGATLQAWQHHFDGAGKLQKLAAEAKALGLVTHVGGSFQEA